MKTLKTAAASLFIAAALWCSPAAPQTITPGQTVIPMGQCQIPAATLASAGGFAGCQGASTTATCSGTTLTAASTTGQFKIGQTLSGTGIVSPTTVVAFGSSTGGNGTITVSQACTSSSNTVTASGIPLDNLGRPPTLAVLLAETANIRWRDDGGAPTASVGLILSSTATLPYTYVGTMNAPQFIAASGSPILDVAFYRTAAP